MAAIGNLIGTILVGFLAHYLSTGDVSQTIASIVDLSSFSLDHALIAISFGLLANILFSLGCTYYGFPSSQSNALVGGLTGSAMALAALAGKNWFSAVGWDAWEQSLDWLLWLNRLGLRPWLWPDLSYSTDLPQNEKRRYDPFLHPGPDRCLRIMSIAHGIQDGAKFIGVYLVIAAMLKCGTDSSEPFDDGGQSLRSALDRHSGRYRDHLRHSRRREVDHQDDGLGDGQIGQISGFCNGYCSLLRSDARDDLRSTGLERHRQSNGDYGLRRREELPPSPLGQSGRDGPQLDLDFPGNRLDRIRFDYDFRVDLQNNKEEKHPCLVWKKEDEVELLFR
jgi:hypothetical protein